MPTRPDQILDTLAAVLNGMDGVFSTPQWGGRAYKVARPGAARTQGKSEPKGKIVAFMALDGSGKAVQVSFKIPPDDARSACERYDWIQPHSFRTLAPSGWLTATVASKRHVGALTRLLVQSHALHGVLATGPTETAGASRATDADASHIDRVMDKVRDDGWSPRSDW
ncbi:MAG: hypothetical protein V3S08_09635 [Phycisphaerales bacterium]